MKLSQSLLVTSSLVALTRAQGWGNTTVLYTQVVTAYTTYCPVPTSVVVNNQTYTATTATTLTITNCPCTIVGVVTSPAPLGTGAATATPPSPTAPLVFTGGAVVLGQSLGALVVGVALALLL